MERDQLNWFQMLVRCHDSRANVKLPNDSWKKGCWQKNTMMLAVLALPTIHGSIKHIHDHLLCTR